MATRAIHQSDGDDDGAGDHGREEAHDVLRAEGLADAREDEVQQAGAGDAHTGVGQRLSLGQTQLGAGGDNTEVAAQEGEGGAQEHGDLLTGDQVHEQRGQAREEQRGGDAQAGQDRDQHGCAEHGEEVLHTEDQHFRRAEDARVVNRAVNGRFFLFSHFHLYLSK